MCGIVGYVGSRDAVPVLINALKRLEYRGYDSAGLAVVMGSKLRGVRKVGKVQLLAQEVENMDIRSTIGIAHTRWATHGEPSVANAHPQFDCTGTIAVVHNGIIENHAVLKTVLERNGHRFTSNTDTEVVAHLIEEHLKSSGSLQVAIRQTLTEIEGTYGLAVLSCYDPGVIVVARKGSPLVVGVGNGEFFIASDAAALLPFTKKVIYLSDGEMAVISKDRVETKDVNDCEVRKETENIEIDLNELEKGGYPHFMLKEIFEQPATIRDAMRGRLLESEGIAMLGGLRDHVGRILNARRFVIAACGTSWHAGLIGKYLLEHYTRIPVDVEYASEFRHRNPILSREDVVFVVSQSGETADTLAALREAKRKGALALGICNVVGSTIARESDGGVFLHAGPEIGVASTKAFTSQLTIFVLIALMIARHRGMSRSEGQNIIRELRMLPEKIAEVCRESNKIRDIAERFCHTQHFLYLGRGYNFPVALEGALKLKEISYIHAEGYPSAEMKHGPIALIDENMPVVFIAPRDQTYEKVLGNVEEVRARRGVVLAVTNDCDDTLMRLSEHVIRIPKTLDTLNPILTVIPLQLLAYHIATLRGCNVDQPRNLAKSVTVE
ncbi:MAG TPA: glutamine--fructose-6-phosphate transaminase (isomerizing) [Bacteroidota bacterium]